MYLRSCSLLARIGQAVASPLAASSSSVCSRLLRPASYTTIAEPDPAYLTSEEPKFVQPISITQLDNLCRNPTLSRLVNSATFLKSQLPARLDNHLTRLKALDPSNQDFADLLETSIQSKQQGLEVSSDWALIDTSNMAGLEHFEFHLASFKEHLEVEIDRLVAGCNMLAQQGYWFDDPEQVLIMDRALDLSHWYLLSARVMLTQHSAALHNLLHGNGSTPTPITPPSSSSSSSSHPVGGLSGYFRGISSSSRSMEARSNHVAAAAEQGVDPGVHYHELLPSETSATTPWHPPHQELVRSRPVNLIQRHAPVERLVSLVVEDCRAFCVEKNSAAPDVVIDAPEGLQATLVVPYVEFVLMEVLKNALQATIDRYGAWDVDEADPVRIVVREGTDKRQMVEFEITDKGNGIPGQTARNMYHYFWSSRQSKFSLLYGYSRNHGAVFQGKGVGVPMCRVYSHFMGGSIEWETDAWKRHTTVKLRLPKNGFVL